MDYTHDTNDDAPSLFHFNFISFIVILLPLFGAISNFYHAHMFNLLRVMVVKNFFNLSVLLRFDNVNHSFPFTNLKPVDELENLPQNYIENFLDVADGRYFPILASPASYLVFRHEEVLVLITQSNFEQTYQIYANGYKHAANYRSVLPQ